MHLSVGLPASRFVSVGGWLFCTSRFCIADHGPPKMPGAVQTCGIASSRRALSPYPIFIAPGFILFSEVGRIRSAGFSWINLTHFGRSACSTAPLARSLLFSSRIFFAPTHSGVHYGPVHEKKVERMVGILAQVDDIFSWAPRGGKLIGTRWGMRIQGHGYLNILCRCRRMRCTV